MSPELTAARLGLFGEIHSMKQVKSDIYMPSPGDLKKRLEAERSGCAFLYYQDEGGSQQIIRLEASKPTITVGRAPGSGIALEWDDQVSRLHAEFSMVGEHWTLVDDGLSSNGSFVGGRRINGRCRLRDGDEIRIGATALIFRLPVKSSMPATRITGNRAVSASLSPAQRNVLVALCRPYRDGGQFVGPATNKEIAEELFLTVPAVKGHLRGLAKKFEVDDLPQNSKRMRLVEIAFQSGLVIQQDL